MAVSIAAIDGVDRRRRRQVERVDPGQRVDGLVSASVTLSVSPALAPTWNVTGAARRQAASMPLNLVVVGDAGQLRRQAR